MKRKLLTLASVLLVSLCGYSQAGNFEQWNTPANIPGAGGPTNNWYIYNSTPDNGISWQQSNPADTNQPAYAGTHAAYLPPDNVVDGITGNWLVTNHHILFGGSYDVKFASRMQQAGDQGGVYKLMVNNVPGSSQTTWSDYVVAQQWTEEELNPQQTEYSYHTISLAQFANTTFYFAFVREGATADGWLIDSFDTAYHCPDPTNIEVTNLTADAVTVSWDVAEVVGWEVMIVPQGVPPTGNGIMTNTPSYTFTGLAGGDYDIYVRAICDGTQSTWVPADAVEIPVNAVSGILRYDTNGDGQCTTTDAILAGAEVVVSVNDNPSYSVYTNAQGGYFLNNLPSGSNAVSLQVTPPTGFSAIAPVTQTVVFDENTNEEQIDLCLPTPDAVTDVSVLLVPLNSARPGFETYYKLMVNNHGSVPVNGLTASVTFDSARLAFIGAVPGAVINGNTLSFTVDATPYSATGIWLQFMVLQPPVNIGGEQLVFTSTLSAVEGDVTPDDNASVLSQTIVNSWDPNDIVVHEGPTIDEDKTGNYLNYTIRFQNTGSADAVNIRIENTLGDKLNWDTLELTGSSHEYTAVRVDNVVEFKFDNIHLPDDETDEPGSHGFVTYRVKPKANVALGDIMTNDADIFFDFNPAVATNTAETEVVQTTAGVKGFAANTVKVYPNPAKNTLYIGLKDQQLQNVALYDINGRLCLTSVTAEVNLQTLQPGMYFVKVTTDKGMANYKIVKE